ncbi:pheromone receptor transcription factor-like [Miscanthus floridulus]|uniref:pheromone receptor transcription factor-like n=1 Tax=Miscanthus floridulus TaxID=154761 RepID=UPI003458733A
MRMPRRPRRSGIRYIENNNSRSISFSKRRDGLFKMAANLSTLTGARIAIVLEAENGKMSGFSAPSFSPIMDSFLSEEEGGAPEGPDEQEKDMIAKLQKEIMQLEESKVMREQRAVESLARVKAIQERSRMGKLIYSKVDDLCVDELNELLRGLARIGQEIRGLLDPPPWVEIGGSSRGPPPLRLFPPPHSQVQEPPRRLPWVSSQSQPSLSSLRSSCTLPQSMRPQVSVMSPPVQPSSLQAISRMLLRHTQLSQRPASLMVRPQAPVMMPLPNEAHQYNYQSLGVDITGNTSGHFSQTSMLSSLPPPPPPLPTSALQIPSQRSVEVGIPFEALNFNPDVQSENHANPHSILENNDEVSHFFGGIGGTTPTHSFTGNEQPSLIPCGASGGQHAPGCHNVPCPSGSNGETYEWLSKTLLESSSEGGSSSDDDGAGGLGNMDWFGDDN